MWSSPEVGVLNEAEFEYTYRLSAIICAITGNYDGLEIHVTCTLVRLNAGETKNRRIPKLRHNREWWN